MGIVVYVPALALSQGTRKFGIKTSKKQNRNIFIGFSHGHQGGSGLRHLVRRVHLLLHHRRHQGRHVVGRLSGDISISCIWLTFLVQNSFLFQSLVLFGSFLAVLVKGTVDAGGVARVMENAQNTTRIEFFKYMQSYKNIYI
jgi:hypothetical protein